MINISAIQGVTPPAPGVNQVTAITPTAQYTGAVAWMPNHDPFGYSTTYTVTITLTADPNFTFTGLAANFFTIAGATSVSFNATIGVITAVFPATPAAPVPATITTASLPNGMEETPYNATVTAIGDPTITWSRVSEVPCINGLYEFRVTPFDMPFSVYNSGVIVAARNIVANALIMTQDSQLKAWSQNGVLNVDGLTPDSLWGIYNLAGALVHQGLTSNGDTTAKVMLSERGIYIIRSGNQTLKVVF